jgi:hypothetical protein
VSVRRSSNHGSRFRPWAPQHEGLRSTRHAGERSDLRAFWPTLPPVRAASVLALRFRARNEASKAENRCAGGRSLFVLGDLTWSDPVLLVRPRAAVLRADEVSLALAGSGSDSAPGHRVTFVDR